jgi:hypothetical protein
MEGQQLVHRPVCVMGGVDSPMRDRLVQGFSYKSRANRRFDASTGNLLGPFSASVSVVANSPSGRYAKERSPTSPASRFPRAVRRLMLSVAIADLEIVWGSRKRPVQIQQFQTPAVFDSNCQRFVGRAPGLEIGGLASFGYLRRAHAAVRKWRHRGSARL